ncbi:hypothetical protein Tco_1316896 [Tanacetum coccineum]
MSLSSRKPSCVDNLTLGRSLSRHSTLEVDQINHQFLGADNGSSPLACLIPNNQCSLRNDSICSSWTKQDGAPQGEELGLIKPLLDSSFSCSDKLFSLQEGAKSIKAPKATGASPGLLSINLKFHLSSRRKT